MILEGPVRQLRSQKQRDEAMKRRGGRGGVGGQGVVCSRILMSTKGNILFFGGGGYPSGASL